MPSYHFSAQIVSRAKGRSAIAAAAYRAGERLVDPRSGQVHDYSQRRGVVHAEVMLPAGVPEALRDRQTLFAAIEAAEIRRDAQLCREFNMSLPVELSDAERLELVRAFVLETFVARGMACDVALHAPVAERGDDPRNFHCHILTSLRQVGPEGLYRTKTREWNRDTELTAWRAAWASHQNTALERAGHRDRVDHRTLAAQREDAQGRGDRAAAIAFDREPEIHIGPKARQIGARAGRDDYRPQSRSRKQATARPRGGAWRSAKEPAKRAREVDYIRIDRGNRLEHNLGRIERNAARIERETSRLQRRAAQFRARQQRLRRAAYEVDRAAEQVAWLKARKRERDAEALWRSIFTVRRRVERRSPLLEALTLGIDRALTDLFGIQTRGHRRAQSQRELARGRTPARGRPGRGGGRERARRPTGPST